MTKTITVNVFNVTHTDPKNYITCIKVPNYSQMGRTMQFLRNYLKEQSANDFNFKRMRYYVFHSNTFLIKEVDLSIH